MKEKNKSFKQKVEAIKEGPLDIGYKVIAGVLSALPPGLGTAATTLWSFIAPPIQRRQTEFLNEIAETLDDLQKKLNKPLTISDLVENEEFQTTLAKSMQVVTRTHSEEKRRILKNVVINSAFRKSQDEDETVIFLDYIDRFSTNHIALLSLYDDPEKWFENEKITLNITMGGFSHLISTGLHLDRDIYDQLTRDLYNSGLIKIDTEGIHTTMSRHGLFSSRTTNMGKRFIKFISNELD